jgi:hypothetical protein
MAGFPPFGLDQSVPQAQIQKGERTFYMDPFRNQAAIPEGKVMAFHVTSRCVEVAAESVQMRRIRP